MKEFVAIFFFLLASPALAASYSAWGDSIAKGNFANPTSYGWVSLLSDALTGSNTTIVNNGVAGDEVPDMTAHVYGYSPAAGDFNFLLIGTNDERIYCPSPCSSPASAALQGYFRSGLEALAAYLALPAKHTARDGSVTYAGTGWGNTGVYGIGENSNINGDTASWSDTGNVEYIGVIQQDSAPGQCSFYVDGSTTAAAVFNTATTGLGPTVNGVTYGAALVRIPIGGSISTSHTISVKITSASAPASRCYIDWHAGNYQPSGLSKVYVSNIIYAQSYSSGGSNANVDAFNSRISALISELSGDGLSAYLVDNNAAINPATDLDGGYHPVRGHTKIFVREYCTVNGSC